MTTDPTEGIRRLMVAEINSADNTRATLEQEYGKNNVWTTDEVREQFEVIGFMAPFCIVKRKSDGAKGSLMFSHSPRFYFSFQED